MIKMQNSINPKFSAKYEHNIELTKLSTYRANLLKEIDLIQSVINRMANTSFMIKGWTISLMTFIVTFKVDDSGYMLILLPLLLFWFLDGFFLQQGRLYRSLYDWVIKNRMTDETNTFSLDTRRFKSNKQNSILQAIFSTTLLSFYGMTLLLVVLVILIK